MNPCQIYVQAIMRVYNLKSWWEHQILDSITSICDIYNFKNYFKQILFGKNQVKIADNLIITVYSIYIVKKNNVKRYLLLFGNDCKLKILSAFLQTFLRIFALKKKLLEIRYSLLVVKESQDGTRHLKKKKKHCKNGYILKGTLLLS